MTYLNGAKILFFYTSHPSFTDEYRMWKPVFDFMVEVSPELMRRSDDVVKAKSVKSKVKPICCGVNDMVASGWVVKVEFWDFFDTKKTEVMVWPACEEKPVFVRTVFVVLCLLEKRVVD